VDLLPHNLPAVSCQNQEAQHHEHSLAFWQSCSYRYSELKSLLSQHIRKLLNPFVLEYPLEKTTFTCEKCSHSFAYHTNLLKHKHHCKF
jgi:hypothetical protein